MARFIILILFSLNLYSQIKLDGKVDAAEWQNSEKYTLDYEIEPSYNGPAEHKTEAFVKHDDSYLMLHLRLMEIRITLGLRLDQEIALDGQMI